MDWYRRMHTRNTPPHSHCGRRENDRDSRSFHFICWRIQTQWNGFFSLSIWSSLCVCFVEFLPCSYALSILRSTRFRIHRTTNRLSLCFLSVSNFDAFYVSALAYTCSASRMTVGPIITMMYYETVWISQSSVGPLFLSIILVSNASIK